MEKKGNDKSILDSSQRGGRKRGGTKGIGFFLNGESFDGPADLCVKIGGDKERLSSRLYESQ